VTKFDELENWPHWSKKYFTELEINVRKLKAPNVNLKKSIYHTNLVM